LEACYRRNKESQLALALDDNLVTATGPLLPPRPQRDCQRRPRGIYERTASDDDLSRGSRPFDETPSLGGVASVGSGPPRSDANLRADRNPPCAECTTARRKHEETSTKYARALQGLAKQEKALQNLLQQLKGSTVALEAAKRDLQQSKAESAKCLQLFEDATARIFRERIEIDEQLRKEMQANQFLTRKWPI
jgi:hypothetical protein